MLRKSLLLLSLAALPIGLANAADPVPAKTETTPKVAMKGHPEKQHVAAVVPKSEATKPKPAPKAEKAPKATADNQSWVPGDYYWDGGDWNWADGYYQDIPYMDTYWVPGHWNERFWGWTWVPGYWD
jgi:hypothetical protein